MRRIEEKGTEKIEPKTGALELVNLSVEIGFQKLIENLSVRVEAGTMLIVRGANGSGKSTLLRTLAGLLDGYEGAVTWDNKPISNKENFHLATNFLGDNSGLADDLNGRENLELHQKMCEKKKKGLNIDEAMKRFEVQNFQYQLVKYMSAGQKQRLALSRLLMFDCPLWILDEPFNCIDRATQTKLETEIDLRLNSGGIVLIISHFAFKSQNNAKEIFLNG